MPAEPPDLHFSRFKYGHEFCRVDDESEFFTLGGSLLASGTGEVGFVTAQANKKAKKRRRSEAVTTDAPVAKQPAPDAQPSSEQRAARPTSKAATCAHANAGSAVGGPAHTSKPGNSQGQCYLFAVVMCSHALPRCNAMPL